MEQTTDFLAGKLFSFILVVDKSLESLVGLLVGSVRWATLSRNELSGLEDFVSSLFVPAEES